MRANLNSVHLLRAIVRQSPAVTREEIGELAKSLDDWNSCLELAKEHRVSSLLHRRLSEAGDAVPPSVLATLNGEYQLNYLQCLANAAELIQLLKDFDRESIAGMPFKGIVLSAMIYGDLAARAAGDLDVLISFHDLSRATALLVKRGFELETPTHADGSPAVANYFEYHFQRPTDGMIVELRWKLELAQSRFQHELGMDWIWPSRSTIKVAGAEVPEMSAEITLPTLCMHGSKHVWSRLNWICDVAQLIAARPALDWDETIRQSRRNGLWRSLTLGVLLAVRVCGATVPGSVMKRFNAESSLVNLARYLDENLFNAPGFPPTGIIPYNIHILDNRDRARLLFSLDYLKPNDRDLAAIRLPKPLYPLYYFIRPLRMLFDRSPRI
jgi:hypothetical protein